MSPFCRFLASFSLKYDVIDAILEDIKKKRVQYLRSLCLIRLKFCRLLELKKGISILLDLKFVAMETKTRIISFVQKQKTIIF